MVVIFSFLIHMNRWPNVYDLMLKYCLNFVLIPSFVFNRHKQTMIANVSINCSPLAERREAVRRVTQEVLHKEIHNLIRKIVMID